MEISCSDSGSVAINWVSTSICTFLAPGFEVSCTPQESEGEYFSSNQSIVNPAELMSLIQEGPLTAGQYHWKPEFTPVSFHSIIL